MEDSPSEGREENLYAAPSAPIETSPGGPLFVPASFLGKFALACRLYLGNLATIALLVLIVWLPANLVIDQALATSQGENELVLSFRLNNLVEGLFGPPVTGAILTLVAARMEGRRLGFFQALRAGLGSWGALLWARIIAGFFMLAGFLAFIVPGIVLAVRYSLIDPVVVLEGHSSGTSRERSTRLVKGRGWQIVLLWLGSSGLTMGWILVATIFQEEALGPDGGYGFTLASECVGDLLGEFTIVWLFLYYWEAARKDQRVRLPDEA